MLLALASGNAARSSQKQRSGDLMADAGDVLGTSLCLALRAAPLHKSAVLPICRTQDGSSTIPINIKRIRGSQTPYSFYGGEGGIRTLDRAFDPILP